MLLHKVDYLVIAQEGKRGGEGTPPIINAKQHLLTINVTARLQAGPCTRDALNSAGYIGAHADCIQ